MRSFTSGFIGAALSLAVLLVAYLILVFPPHQGEEEMQSNTSSLFSRLPSTLRAFQRQVHVQTTSPFLTYTKSNSRSNPAHRAAFSTTANKMGYADITFLDAIKNRRTIYGLDKNVTTTSDATIKEIVERVVRDVPSSFNSQSTRVIVLFKEDHNKFWDITTEILKGIVPEEQWGSTGSRMAMFRAAYGTALFYEDPAPIKALQTKLPAYADKFPTWSEHTSAMHQYALWTALEAEGLGASLQHYNPLPDQKASEQWKIPLEWSLKAQLVFGNPVDGKRAHLNEKQFEPIEKRVTFHGA